MPDKVTIGNITISRSLTSNGDVVVSEDKFAEIVALEKLREEIIKLHLGAK